MAAIDDFTAAMAACAAALDAGDLETARRKVLVARTYLAQLPNSAADGVSAQWRADLNDLDAAIRRESGVATPSATSLCEFQQ